MIIFVTTDHDLSCQLTDAVSCRDKEDPTFSASLRDAVILDFLYKNKQHFYFFLWSNNLQQKTHHVCEEKLSESASNN